MQKRLINRRTLVIKLKFLCKIRNENTLVMRYCRTISTLKKVKSKFNMACRIGYFSSI